MLSGLRVGAFPVKVTVPLTDESATATLGQTDTVNEHSRHPQPVPCSAHAPAP